MSFHCGRNVLVTGGSGFVGSHMLEALLAHGANVTITRHHRAPVVADSCVRVLDADLTQLEDCVRVMEGMDDVYHCAGSVFGAGMTVSPAVSPVMENTVLAARVFDACVRSNVSRLLVFSSSTVYPETTYPIAEHEMWSGEIPPSYFGYGWMRRYIERMAQYVSDKTDLNIALVRPTAVYGPRDSFDLAHCHVVPALIARALQGETPFEVWGTGKEQRDFLYIKDLVRGCLLMMERAAKCQPMNIGYGASVSIAEVARMVLKAAGRSDADLVFNPDKPVTIQRRLVNTQLAQDMLEFRPEYSLEAGIRETVDWAKAALAV